MTYQIILSKSLLYAIPFSKYSPRSLVKEMSADANILEWIVVLFWLICNLSEVVICLSLCSLLYTEKLLL